MARKPRKPRPISVHPVRLYATRGPHKDGSGRWYWKAILSRNGTQRAVWTGWARPDAAAQAVADLVATGRLESSEAAEEISTLKHLLEYWLGMQTERRDIAASTLRGYTYSAKRLAQEIGDVRLDRVDGSTLRRFRDTRLRAGGATGTVKLELTHLRQAWAWGREVGACPARDLPRVRLIVKPTREHPTPSPGEVAAVIRELEGWPRLVVLLLHATGARIGEVACLTWEDIDLEEGLLTLRGKTGRRVVPLAASAMEALADWRLDQPDGQLFGVRPKTVEGQIRSRYLPRACKAAGVPRFTAKCLRNAAVDALMRAGVDLGTYSALIGHSPKVALEYYRRATLDDRRRAVASAGLGFLPEGKVLGFGQEPDS